MPPALVHGQPLPAPHPINNMRMAQANLNRPNFLPPPRVCLKSMLRFPGSSRWQSLQAGVWRKGLPAKANVAVSSHDPTDSLVASETTVYPGHIPALQTAAATPPGRCLANPATLPDLDQGKAGFPANLDRDTGNPPSRPNQDSSSLALRPNQDECSLASRLSLPHHRDRSGEANSTRVSRPVSSGRDLHPSRGPRSPAPHPCPRATRA